MKNYRKHILNKHPKVSKEDMEKIVVKIRGEMKNKRKEMKQRLKDFFRGSESKCFLCGRSNCGMKMKEHLTSVHGLKGSILENLIEGKFLSSMGCKIRCCQDCGKKYVCQKEKLVSNHDCHEPVPKKKVINMIIIKIKKMATSISSLH